MKLFKRRKILVTHGGGFHVDDLFASSAFYLLHKGNVKIKRIKRGELVSGADYVYDVGGVYDREDNKFDHHQKGAPVRENGIPYSSFGLVWEKYGVLICGGDEAVADRIEKRIVIPVDADDNGVLIWKPVFEEFRPYQFVDYLMTEKPSWLENKKNIDIIFKKLTKKIASVLKREIKVARDDVLGERIIKEAYNKSQDKRVIFLERDLPRYLYQEVLSSLKEPLFVIMPTSDNQWKVEAVRKDSSCLESRKPFPVEWRGLLDQNKLEELTGIMGVVFCHPSGFLVSCLSRESAIKLTNKAITD